MSDALSEDITSVVIMHIRIKIQDVKRNPLRRIGVGSPLQRMPSNVKIRNLTQNGLVNIRVHRKVVFRTWIVPTVLTWNIRINQMCQKSKPTQ